MQQNAARTVGCKTIMAAVTSTLSSVRCLDESIRVCRNFGNDRLRIVLLTSGDVGGGGGFLVEISFCFREVDRKLDPRPACSLESKEQFD